MQPMCEFYSDYHDIYYCGQDSLRRNGMTIIVNKRVQKAVFGCNLKNDRRMKVKEESGKFGLKLNIQKTKIMGSGHITSWQIDGET